MSALFDRLAKMAAGNVSRRAALKSLGGVLVGGLFAVLPHKATAETENERKKHHENIIAFCRKYCAACPPHRHPAGGHQKCLKLCHKCLEGKNPAGKACGVCTPKNPFTCCPPTTNCCANGTCCATVCCGLVCCGEGLNCCANGTCCATACCGRVCCATGLTCCANLCLDTQTDKHNCGTCGNKCHPRHVCVGGKCERRRRR